MLHVALVGGRAVDALRLVLVRWRALLRAVSVPLENRVVDLLRVRVELGFGLASGFVLVLEI